MKRACKILSLIALAVPFILGNPMVVAKEYIVEAIIFENALDSNITEPHAYQAPKKPRTGAKAWVLEKQLLLRS